MRTKIATLPACLILLLSAGLADAQGPRLYKWVDEDGNVHYSDRVEGTIASRGVERLSASGIRIGNPHSALPRNRDEARQHEQDRRLAQQDTMLMTSYASEIELLRAHDESRAQIEASIRTAQGNVERLLRAIDVREAGNRPGGSDPELNSLRDQLASEQERIGELRERRFELHERQNHEVARFRELSTTRNG